MADFVLDTFGPYDLIPAPEVELLNQAEDRQSTWDETYTVPDDLVDAAMKVEGLKAAKRTGQGVWSQPDASDIVDIGDLGEIEALKVDHERREKMTKTLAYLHSRGQQTSLLHQ